MQKQLKEKLIKLAATYETAGFLLKDPSQFMHRYSTVTDQEIVAFTAASLAFGRRDQILKHVEFILNLINGSPSQWILSGAYKDSFPEDDSSFYRMYSFKDMRIFFERLNQILIQDKSLGEHYRKLYPSEKPFCFVIAADFPKECRLIPHTETSSCKKLNMFLRWMVRDNSPVDLGLWTWIDKNELLMPMDTHVVEEASKLKLLPLSKSGKPCGATIKTCIALTEKLKEVFPGDPVKADFALFGLGVDETVKE